MQIMFWLRSWSWFKRRRAMSARWKVFVVVVVLVGVLSVGTFSTGTIGTQIADNAAKSLWGGDCSWLDTQAQGACTTNQSTDCLLYIHVWSLACYSKCAFQCSSTSRVVNGSSSFGNIVSQGQCASVIEPQCQLIGDPFPPVFAHCECTGGSNTTCAADPTGFTACGG